ncbi:DUF86 domain-containing protein [Candidatus Saganbacteria bacterium]|nr:DUF86 domain-containing protein [Candidatus Saganbacteria bacterium]
MSPLDENVIDTRIQKIRSASNKLARFKEMVFDEFKNNSDNIDIAERNLEVSIEAMLDVGNHIIASLGLGKPEDYYDIIKLLGEKGVISKDFANKIAPLAGLRNRIVHDYLEIDHKLLLQNIKDHLADFEFFSKEILSFTKKQG